MGPRGRPAPVPARALDGTLTPSTATSVGGPPVFVGRTADSVVTDGVGVTCVAVCVLRWLVLDDVLVEDEDVLVDEVVFCVGGVFGGGEPVAALPAILNDCTAGVVQMTAVPSIALRRSIVRRPISGLAPSLSMRPPHDRLLQSIAASLTRIVIRLDESHSSHRPAALPGVHNPR